MLKLLTLVGLTTCFLCYSVQWFAHTNNLNTSSINTLNNTEW